MANRNELFFYTYIIDVDDCKIIIKIKLAVQFFMLHHTLEFFYDIL